MARAPWYRIEAKAKTPDAPDLTDSADVWIYDEIGAWGISAADFAKELRDLKVANLAVHLNSPGGEVFDGIAIYNALRGHNARVSVNVDGLAASIASVIAMAGDEVSMSPHAQMMIHDAHGIAAGNAADMAKAVDLYNRCSDVIANVYADRAGGTGADWRERMRAETWFSAKEALDAGLIDRIGGAPDGTVALNKFDLSAFNYAGRAAAPAPELPAVLPPVTCRTAPASTPPDRPAPGPAASDPSPVLTDESLAAAMAAFAAVPVAVREPAVAFDPDAFRALVLDASRNVSAPDRPVAPGPAVTESDGPTPIDLRVFEQALRRAIK